MGARITVQRSRAARFARTAGVFSVPVLVLTALGHRYGLVPETALVALISTGILFAILGVSAGLYALVDIWQNGEEGAGSAVLGVVYSVPGTLLFAAAVYALAVYPRLNDISTDTVDPPAYLTLRGIPADRVAPPPPDRRDVQLSAYPDITARRYPVNLRRVFDAVKLIVEDRGWQVVAVSEPGPEATQAAIQAVSRTLLFRFTDHVVIRMISEPGGTRVDVRSASTYGLHDLGQNARRIRAFLAALDLALQGERSDI